MFSSSARAWTTGGTIAAALQGVLDESGQLAHKNRYWEDEKFVTEWLLGFSLSDDINLTAIAMVHFDGGLPPGHTAAMSIETVQTVAFQPANTYTSLW